MQRKQQVGECWVCVIFFACVCGWVHQIRQLHLTIPSPRYMSCESGTFLGVSQGGAGMPPWLRTTFGAVPQIFFWAVFAIFSGFVN
jgi:hypothetical protein